MIQKALTLCYPPGSIVPTPDTLHYTLGEHPSHLIWTQDRRPFYDIQLNALTNREISLSHDDRLEWITQETITICVFLPPPDTALALSPRSETEMLETQQPEHADLSGNGKSNSPSTQEQLYHYTPTLTRQGEPYQESQEHDLLQEETLTPSHQIFVRNPDTWTDKVRKPAFTQTVPVPTSLDTLKDGLSALISIPTHHFNILYGGKILHSRVPLATQGVTKYTTVWLTIGGLLGGADTDMLDSPQLASSAPTPIHRPPPTHSHETQVSIEEWIDRLRMSSPLTQDLATVNMLMTALNLTEDQATTAITETLNEGDDDKTTDVSRYQEVYDTFPDNFQKYLEAIDIPFPVGPLKWMALSDSFKAHMAGVTQHVEFKLNPARKHRLGHKASGSPKDLPTSTLRQNETFTLSNLNIFSVRPLIMALTEVGFQPGTTGF